MSRTKAASRNARWTASTTSGRMLYIHPGECVDCGACEPVCPVEAIFYDEDVPEQWAQFTAENARFFDQLGSPAGPATTPPLPCDPDPAPPSLPLPPPPPP